MKKTIVTVGLKALGTAALALGFVFMVGRAPFIANSADETDIARRTMEAQSSTPPELQIDTGALQSSILPSMPDATDEDIGFAPTLGLFNASFAASDGHSGFVTAEHRIPGSCADAGLRFIETECPTCEVIGGGEAGDSEMLMWRQVIETKNVFQTVSRNCVSIAPDGVPIVGALRFGEGLANLTEASIDLAEGIVPLLPGATRVASINLGAWFATYDEIARPSTALVDMARKLGELGWREVSDPGAQRQGAFQGQRVFTNSSDATCVISLTKQDDIYQLMTVINSRA
jgi:hypothetical protein